MKKILGMVLTFLFVVFATAFSQQQNNNTQATNGWGLLLPVYGTQDPLMTTTYLLQDSGQVFKNYGKSQDLTVVSLKSGLLAMNWSKNYPSRFIPQEIRAGLNLSNETNVDSVESYIGLQDSLGNWFLSGQKYILKHGLNNIVWDMSLAKSKFSTLNRITLLFQFRTSVPYISTGGDVCLMSLMAFDGKDSSDIDLVVRSVTGVSNSIVQNPKDFELSQNYPNPFNPSTTIRYSVPKMEHVNLSVFNSLGQEVKNLVSETKTQGSYEVNFDASNLSSGIYFYRLQAGSFVEMKKMIFLK